MKNNSFKQYGPAPSKWSKKLVLTALLATVLSGPYVYQVSSKDFSFSEFASTAAELSEYDRLEIEYKVHNDRVLELVRKSDPKYKDITELPASTTPGLPETTKAAIQGIEQRKATLITKKAEADTARQIKEAQDAKLKAREEAEKAEKKKKEEAAEAKRLDCNDKDKDAKEKRECREDAKREEKEKKTEEASKKFDDRLENAMDRCERGSSKDAEALEDRVLACKSKAFIAALKNRDKDLTMTAVNAQFKHLLGDDLFKMLYSDDERDAERASIILSNIFNGKVPSQFAGLKRMIMDEVRRRADAPAKKVQAEFKKANQFAQGSNERFAQTNVAIAAKSELDNRISAYSASMYDPLVVSRDTDALSYYKTSYQKGLEALSLRIMSGMTITGGEKGGATRGGEVRGGTSTEARVVTNADGKMVRGGGVEYSLVSPGTISNIRFGTPASTRSSSDSRGGVRVNN